MGIMVSFVSKQGSKMRHTITDLEDKLSKMYEETEREVSLFDE